jgi:hypothetical protein
LLFFCEKKIHSFGERLQVTSLQTRVDSLESTAKQSFGVIDQALLAASQFAAPMRSHATTAKEQRDYIMKELRQTTEDTADYLRDAEGLLRSNTLVKLPAQRLVRSFCVYVLFTAHCFLTK